MNWDIVEGNWLKVKGMVKEQWGKLTDDEIDQIGGRKDQLLGKLQEKYGWGRDEAERQVNDWTKKGDFERRTDFTGQERLRPTGS